MVNLWLMTLKIRVGEIALKASHNFPVACIHALEIVQKWYGHWNMEWNSKALPIGISVSGPGIDMGGQVQ